MALGMEPWNREIHYTSNTIRQTLLEKTLPSSLYLIQTTMKTHYFFFLLSVMSFMNSSNSVLGFFFAFLTDAVSEVLTLFKP